MPTLDWIGKKAVLNHDQAVPFYLLEDVSELSCNGTTNGNLIVQGDNLVALKSLLPYYQGTVKCIYIDPPYNTGNENWIYNDNVRDPVIKAWLGEVVGKEAEDLSRHDKWLCMMYPRLKLLRDFLTSDGSIWVSIDDNECAHLRMLLEEIFGPQNFVADIAWQRTYSPRNDSKGIVRAVEHILVFSKQPDWQPNDLPRDEKMDAKYKNPDGDIMPWTSSDAFAPDGLTHQGMVYAIQHPITGKMIYPSKAAHWRYQQNDMLAFMQGWGNYELRDLGDAKERAEVCGCAVEDVRKDVCGIVLTDSLEEAHKLAVYSAEVTHNHPEGIKGAVAVAEGIWLACQGKSKDEIREHLSQYYDLDFSLDEIRPDYTFDVTCQGSVPQAIVAFLEAESYEDAIRNAISLGGDSDTQASIAGSLAEPFFGIPARLKARAYNYLTPELRSALGI